MSLDNLTIATERTLTFLIRDNQIILGLKKRGFGAGNYNGFGGKLNQNETPEKAAIRELFEETKIVAEKKDLEKMAVIDFYFSAKPAWNQRVHVYFLRTWNGTPTETEEMRPVEYLLSNIPYQSMWESDRIWLPKILSCKKITATFFWKEDNKTVNRYKITELSEF